MKAKKDKFLAAACADLNMETATREHYGYKNKGSTASDASYTIVAKAHVGARMSSSKRRGFMSARPNSVQKGTAAAKKDKIKSKMGREAKKSMKAKHSYVATADLLELAGAYDEMDSWLLSQYEEDIKRKKTRLSPEDWMAKQRGGRARAINRARSATKLLDMIGAGSGLEETLRSAARGSVGMAADERIKKMSYAWKEWHQDYLKKHAPPARASRVAEVRDSMHDLEEFEARRGIAEAEPNLDIPLKKELDVSPEAVSERIKKEMGVGKGKPGTFGFPEEKSPEDLAQSQKAQEESEKGFDEMANEVRAWAVMQWLAKGGAGKYVQTYLNDVRRREDARRAGRVQKLKSRFETGRGERYVKEPEEDWPWAKKARFIKEDIQNNTRSFLTAEQQNALYSLINPELSSKYHDFFTVKKRMDELPQADVLTNKIFESPSFKGLGAAPERLGAEYIWGPEGAKERDTDYERAEEISNMYRGQKQGGLRFNRSLANTMKESLGTYGKTNFDKDLSDIDSSEDVFSWEGTKMGQPAKKQFEAVRSPENYFPKIIADRLKNPEYAGELSRQMRRSMFRPEIKSQMEQIVSAKERAGEIVDRQKIRFMLALRADPNLQALVEENVAGGAGTVLQSMANEFAKENAELMANPISKMDPSNPDLSKQEHVRNFRRYVGLLRRSLPDRKVAAPIDRPTELGKSAMANDYGIRHQLSAYKDAVSEVESKLWALQNERQKLVLQYKDAVVHNAPDQQLELMEQQMDENDMQHYNMLNMAQQYIQRFFKDSETPKTLSRIYNDPNTLKRFTHPEVPASSVTPENILEAGQTVYQYTDVPYSVYSRLFPDRAADAKERGKQAKARESFRKFGEVGGEPSTIPVSSDEEARIQRISTKRAFDRLPSLLKEQHLLNKFMILYPRTDRFTPDELKTIETTYGKDFTPQQALQRFETVKKEVDNIKQITPRSEGEKLLPPLTITKNGETIPLPEEDRAVLLDSIFPGGFFGEYRPPQFGGAMKRKAKLGMLSRIHEGRNKEAIVDRARQMYYDVIRESGAKEPLHSYHDVLKVVGNESFLNSLKSIKQAYVDAAKAELPKEIRKSDTLVPGQDERGTFFTYTDEEGVERRIPYSGPNLKYAFLLDHYGKQAIDLTYGDIRQLAEKKKQFGGILDPASNARLNIAKLIFSIANDEDKTPPMTELDNELWLLGSSATGHEEAGRLHGAWLKMLPEDPLGFVERAVQKSVSPLYHQWAKFRGSEEPLENQYVFPGMTKPSEEAVLGLQRGARGTEEAAENTLRQHELAHPPTNIYGQAPKSYAPPLLPGAFGKETEQGKSITPGITGQTTLEGKGAFSGHGAIVPPISPKLQPAVAPLEARASPRLRDLKSTSGGQSTLSETADAADRYLAKNKKLELHTQGGDGSGESPIGIGATWHGLYNYQRKGPRRSMEALAPMNKQRVAIAANMLPQTNAKNNKPPVAPIFSAKPGGGVPGDIISKYLHQVSKTNKFRNIVAE